MPREERERIQALLHIGGFLRQRNISEKNIAQLERLCESPDRGVQEAAAVVLEVARVKPHKRKRIRFLAKHRRDLLVELGRIGLIPAWVEHDEPE